MKISELRPELTLIADWIESGSKVLDLGCGDGTFLAALREEKQVIGYGIEIDTDNIYGLELISRIISINMIISYNKTIICRPPNYIIIFHHFFMFCISISIFCI